MSNKDVKINIDDEEGPAEVAESELEIVLADGCDEIIDESDEQEIDKSLIYSNNKNNSSFKKKKINKKKKNNNNNNKSNVNNNNNCGNNNNNRSNNDKKIGFFDCVTLRDVRDSIKNLGIDSHPLNSWVLWMNYKLANFVYIVCYSFLCVSWLFVSDPIVCIKDRDIEKKIDGFHKNICLSYPYVEDDGGVKRFLHFYRWIPLTFLLMSVAMYLPRVVMKYFNNPRLKQVLIDLQSKAHLYTNTSDSSPAWQYLDRHLGSHNYLYVLFIANHFLTAIINILLLYFIDFLLQGRFLHLPHKVYPFARNMSTFQDYLSLTFPPFVSCEINSHMKMVGEGNVDLYNCHLTLMEVYEKVFILTWFVLTLLIAINITAVFCLSIAVFPPFNFVFLRTCVSSWKLIKIKRKIISNCNYGDIFVLNLIRQQISDVEFRSVLQCVAEKVELKENNETSFATKIASVSKCQPRSSTPILKSANPSPVIKCVRNRKINS